MARSRAQREAPATFQALGKAHPDAHCELDHHDPFELIVATVLSAQSTDVAVNRITPDLFRRWPDAAALAQAPPPEVEKALASIGMYRQKAKNIIGLSKKLVEDHGGEVPPSLDELVKLPGVGRKTANVVLGVAFGAPEGVVVDTHVQRITQRLGWTKHDKPEEIERDLMKLFPRELWDILSHTLIFHGRRICTAQKPACAACPVRGSCPSAFKAENVGRKPPRKRNSNGKPAKKKTAAKARPAAKKRAAKARPAAKKTAARSGPATKRAAGAPATGKRYRTARRR